VLPNLLCDLGVAVTWALVQRELGHFTEVLTAGIAAVLVFDHLDISAAHQATAVDAGVNGLLVLREFTSLLVGRSEPNGHG
jgi:hypothetical protein